MELRHLRYFLAVAEELNFLRASERLHVSQPPLSQQIRDLEEELGVQLFDRTKRQIQLTASGRIFMEKAAIILGQVEQATELARRATRGIVEQLRIGFMVPQHTRLVGEFFRVFARSHPHVHLASHALLPNEQVAAVLDSRIDIAILELPVESRGMIVDPIFNEPLVLAISDRHPLRIHKQISIRTVTEQPCILRPRHVYPTFHDLIVRAFKEAGGTPNITYEQGDIYTALGLVGAGLAVAMVPASIQELPIKHVTFRRVHPTIQLETGIAYRNEQKSAILTDFLDVVKRVSRKRQLALAEALRNAGRVPRSIAAARPFGRLLLSLVMGLPAY